MALNLYSQKLLEHKLVKLTLGEGMFSTKLIGNFFATRPLKKARLVKPPFHLTWEQKNQEMTKLT